MSVDSKNYEIVRNVKPPESLLLFPRLLLQSAGKFPPTYDRRMSFVEQEMAKYVDERTMSPLEAIMDYSRAASVFFTKQIMLYEHAGNIV